MKKINLFITGTLAAFMALSTVSADAQTEFRECLAGEQATCELTEDLENMDTYIKVTRNVTIDLKGHKISRSNGGVVFNINGGTTTFTGDGIVENTNDPSNSNSIIIDGTGSVIIENGTFKSNNIGIAIQGDDNSKLTVNGGTIIGTNMGISITDEYEGEIIINNGTIEGKYGIVAYNGVGKKHTITINNGSITGTSNDAISISGENSTLEIKGGDIKGYRGIGVFGKNVSVTIENGTITAEAFAISGNGRETTNSTIEINGGTLKSTNAAAIYHPQTGSLTITGGTIEGIIGIVARQGIIDIQDGNIKATGTGADVRVGDAIETGKTSCESDEDEGCVRLPQGVAVIVDNHLESSYTTTATVTIKNGTFIVPEGHEAVLDYKNAAEDKSIEISGGDFNVDVKSEYLTEEVEQSEGGVVGKLYNITFEEPENGTIDVPANAAVGEKFTITVEPAEGYKISKVYVNGTEINATSGKYVFTMIANDVKVTAEFTKIETSGDTPNPDDEKTDNETEETTEENKTEET